jgi:hypothetical protein
VQCRVLVENGKDLQQDQKVQLNDPNQKTSHRYNCFLKQQNFMLNSLFTIYVNCLKHISLSTSKLNSLSTVCIYVFRLLGKRKVFVLSQKFVTAPFFLYENSIKKKFMAAYYHMKNCISL